MGQANSSTEDSKSGIVYNFQKTRKFKMGQANSSGSKDKALQKVVKESYLVASKKLDALIELMEERMTLCDFNALIASKSATEIEATFRRQCRIRTARLLRGAGMSQSQDPLCSYLDEMMMALDPEPDLFQIKINKAFGTLRCLSGLVKRQRQIAQRALLPVPRGKPLTSSALKDASLNILESFVGGHGLVGYMSEGKEEEVSLDLETLRAIRIPTLKTVSALLRESCMEPLSIFKEWSPSPARAETLIRLTGSTCRASSVESSEFGAKKVLVEDEDSGSTTKNMWKSQQFPSLNGGTSREVKDDSGAYWEIVLSKPLKRLSSVYVKYEKDLLPNSIIILAYGEDDDKGDDEEEKTAWKVVSSRTKARVTEEEYYYSDNIEKSLLPCSNYPRMAQRFQISSSQPSSVSCLRIYFLGFHKSNVEKKYGVRQIYLFESEHVESEIPRTILGNVAKWLHRTHHVLANTSSKQESLRALEQLSISSGSLEVAMHYARSMMIQDSGSSSSSSSSSSSTSSISSGQDEKKEEDEENMKQNDNNGRFAKVIRDLASRIEQQGCLAVTRSSHSQGVGDETFENVHFDASLSSESITFENGGREIRSTSSSNSHAVLNVSFSGSGVYVYIISFYHHITTHNSSTPKHRYSWEFRIMKDTHGDEMTCIGAAVSSTERIEDSSYERSTELWMYRGYNGFLYARSKLVEGTNQKFHVGDIVTCILDLDAGTLSFVINGGTVQKIMFTDMAGFAISPAVSFYGPSRVVSVISVERLDKMSSSSTSSFASLSNKIDTRVVVALAHINPSHTRTESQVPRWIRKDFKNMYGRDLSLEKLFQRFEFEKRIVVCEMAESCLGKKMKTLDGERIPLYTSICMMPVRQFVCVCVNPYPLKKKKNTHTHRYHLDVSFQHSNCPRTIFSTLHVKSVSRTHFIIHQRNIVLKFGSIETRS
jgi:hypothetical protein